MPDSPRGHAEGASFRDPAGHIYALDGRILRTVHSDAAQNYQAFRSSDLFDRWIEDGKMVDTWDVPPDTLGDLGGGPTFCDVLVEVSPA